MCVFLSHNSCHISKAALVSNLHDWLLYAFFFGAAYCAASYDAYAVPKDLLALFV